MAPILYRNQTKHARQIRGVVAGRGQYKPEASSLEEHHRRRMMCRPRKSDSAIGRGCLPRQPVLSLRYATKQTDEREIHKKSPTPSHQTIKKNIKSQEAKIHK